MKFFKKMQNFRQKRQYKYCMKEPKTAKICNFLNRKVASWNDLSLTEWMSVLVKNPPCAEFCKIWNSFTISQIEKMCAANPALNFYLYLCGNIDFFATLYSLNPQAPALAAYLAEFKARAAAFGAGKTALKDAHLAFYYPNLHEGEEWETPVATRAEVVDCKANKSHGKNARAKRQKGNWVLFFKPDSEFLAEAFAGSGETFVRMTAGCPDVNCGMNCWVCASIFKSGKFFAHADLAPRKLREIGALLAKPMFGFSDKPMFGFQPGLRSGFH